MTIWEYFSEPRPWFNTENYTHEQIIMFFIGSVLWLVCYADVLIGVVRNKVLHIPIAAVLLNFGWEIAASLFFVPDMGKLIVIAYCAWMFFDLFIFLSLFKYGFKQVQVPYFRKHLPFFLILGIVISFFSQLTFMLDYDIPMAPISGYIINLIMSVAFLYLLYIPNYPNSKVAAWSKFLGTGIISVMFYTKYPQDYFLLSMYISVAIFDILYIYHLMRRKSEISSQWTA